MEFYSDYLDTYGNDDLTLDDYDSLYSDERNIQGVVYRCIFPSLTQVQSYILVLLAAGLLCRFLWFCCARLLPGEGLQHWISLICGVLALYGTVGNNFYIVVFLTLNGYVLMQALEYYVIYKHIGPIVAMVLISTHILFELILRTPEAWNTVRGIQMVATMKIISLAYDVSEMRERESSRKALPNLVSYLGYIFCPGSCVIGIWMPYSAYIRNMHKPACGLKRSLLWTFCNVILALLCLILSNCMAPYLCSDNAWKWIRAYRDSMVVRSSHYFILFLSQATLAINGISWNNNTSPNSALGFLVGNPWAIEFPRSLATIVRNWNLPMHHWLKTYVFRSSQKYICSYLMAVLITFIVSSLLHGLHYQVYGVLLSIAFFSYAENVLRFKLATIFSACIKASICRKTCTLKYCDKHMWWHSTSVFYVKLINAMFGLLSVFHLTYLGIMLSPKDEGISTVIDGLERWQKLGYTNHWVALAILFCYYLI